MVNPMGLFRLKGLWEQLRKGHPKMVPFARSVYPGAIAEGTIIDIKVTDPAGKVYHYNMRLTAEDMAALEEAREVGRGMASDQL